MSDTAPTSLSELLRSVGASFARWFKEHEEEIRAAGIWASVNLACREARLYAPLHREAWLQIIAAVDADENDDEDYERVITSIYGPDGVGFDALRQELVDAPLLADRQREVGEVLDSLAEGRNYVTVCGALPLVEYVLSKAAGKWSDPIEHIKALNDRLHEEETEDDFAEIFLEFAAVEMVLEEIPVVWEHGPHRVGAVVDHLNRHKALHGTGVGWDDPTNATRAVLLLAATARVVGVLFKQPTGAAVGA